MIDRTPHDLTPLFVEEAARTSPQLLKFIREGGLAEMPVSELAERINELIPKTGQKLLLRNKETLYTGIKNIQTRPYPISLIAHYAHRPILITGKNSNRTMLAALVPYNPTWPEGHLFNPHRSHTSLSNVPNDVLAGKHLAANAFRKVADRRNPLVSLAALVSPNTFKGLGYKVPDAFSTPEA